MIKKMKKNILTLLMLMMVFPLLQAESVVSYARGGLKTSLEIGWNTSNYGDIQWQISNDNGQTWNNINNATSPVYEFLALNDAFYRAKITTQDLCEPVYVERQVKTVTFNVDVLSTGSNSVDFGISSVNLKDAQIVEYGFAYNLSELNTRNFKDMQRVKAGDIIPGGTSFQLTCNQLQPGSTYSIRVYFKTADGSIIFGPGKIAKTLPGLKWTTENWTITKTSLLGCFELADYTALLGNPNLVFKFGTSENDLQTFDIVEKGNFKYSSQILTNLTPNTTYIMRVEATFDGETHVLSKTVKTLPDYSNVVVDNTSSGVKNTIKWDATKTLVPISPVGLQTEYPRILRVSADTLLCSYHGGSGTDYWVNIYLQKSFDNGKTWTAPTILMDKEKSTIGNRYWRFCNPEMVKLKNGWILMPFTANGNPETNDNCHTLLMISKDNGESWGDPFIVGRGRSWEPMITQLPNGELELFVSSEAAWWGTAGQGPQEILFARSTDNGLTWTSLKRAAYSPDRRDGMPSAVVMQGNKGILFSIEIVNDGGWGSPSLVKRGLNEEWDASPWNNADTNKRWHVPMYAHGGAPYTIQLPTGEIVVMAHVNGRSVWQTSYPRIAVGDSNGKNFITPVTPLTTLPAAEGCYYNSLFLKDSETVWLVMTHSLYNGSTRVKGEIQYLEGKIIKR